MSARPIPSLALASIVDRRLTVTLSVVAVALSVALFVGVNKIRDGARGGFERTIAGTDLIVGARSGPVNVLLYTVFRIGAPTASISWSSYSMIAQRPEVAWAVPLSLGDSYRGYRVVGTTAEFFSRYRYGSGRALELASGEGFSDLFDAVLGAEVAAKLGLRPGDTIAVAHGLGEVSFVGHDDKPFRVAGVLAPTGTPVDRSVHITLGGIEAIHLGWYGGARTPAALAVTAERARAMSLEPDEITAVLVGLVDRSAVLALQRAVNTYEGEPLQAVIPGLALAQLWKVVGTAERTLAAVGAFVVIVGLLGILTGILTSLNERRREMAVLRAIGARPADIFLLLVSEAAMIALAGALTGLALVHAALAFAAPWLEARFGLALHGMAPGVPDVLVVAVVTAAGAALGCVPAALAYRHSLADGLSLRT